MPKVLLLSVLAVFVLAGQVDAQEARVVTVRLHDNPFHILPETIDAQPGENIVFHVINDGSVPHDFRVCRPENEGGCASPLVFLPALQRGGSANLTFTAPAAGTYTYECSIPGHAEGGMTGQLRVGGKSTPGVELPIGILVVLGCVAWRARR